MLPLPDPVLNGVRITHSELRALHQNRRVAIHAATAKYCLDGPRLLDPPAGEQCRMTAHQRDEDGSLLATITVLVPSAGAKYTRRIRLVPWRKIKGALEVKVARE